MIITPQQNAYLQYTEEQRRRLAYVAMIYGDGQTPDQQAANTTDIQRFLYPGTTNQVRRSGTQSRLRDASTLGDERWPPQVGRCYSFDGVDDVILVSSDPASMQITGDFTIAGWIKCTTATTDLSNDTLFSRWKTSLGYMLYFNVGKIRVYRDAEWLEDPTALTSFDGSWVHIATTVSGTLASIYVNGTLRASTNFSASTQGVATYLPEIGKHGEGIGTGPAAKIRDLRLWNAGLSQSDIATVRDNGTIMDNLVAWYKCDDTDPSNAYDSSGNGHHGNKTNTNASTFNATDTGVLYSYANEVGYTLSGSTVVPRNESNTSQDVLGGSLQYSGRVPYDATLGGLPGYTLNGTSEYLEKGSRLTTHDRTALSVTWWGHPTAKSTCAVASEGYTTSERAWYIAFESNKLRIGVSKNGTTSAGQFAVRESTATIELGNWHHYCVTFDSNVIKFYIDGIETGSAVVLAATVNAYYDTAEEFRIGAHPNISYYHAGSLFGMSVHSVALNLSEIQSLKAGEHIARGWVDTFPLSEGSGSTAYGQNGNTLALTSASPATVHGTKNTINDANIRYGCRKESSVFIVGKVDGSAAANDGALTTQPGQQPPDGSFFNRKPYDAPALVVIENDIGALNTSEEVGDSTASPNVATDTATARHTMRTPPE